MLCSHLNCTLVFFINAVLYWWRIIGFQSCSLCAEIYPGSLNLFLLLSTLGDESPYLLCSFVLQNVTFKQQNYLLKQSFGKSERGEAFLVITSKRLSFSCIIWYNHPIMFGLLTGLPSHLITSEMFHQVFFLSFLILSIKQPY